MQATDAELAALAHAVGNHLITLQRRVVTAESCTAGWIGKALTDPAGSSQWFDRGYVTYSDAAKRTELGVQQSTLEQHGAVSEATVLEMAQGALARSGADVALAVSGIAGPGGGNASKPVGTVWFALQWQSAGRRTQGQPGAQARPVTQLRQFPGDRDAVRRQAVAVALQMLLADEPVAQ
jgi:nicotinamide-nucleotide amidase